MTPLSLHTALAAQGLQPGPLLRPTASLAALARRGPALSFNHHLFCENQPLRFSEALKISQFPRLHTHVSKSPPGLGHSHSIKFSQSHSPSHSRAEVFLRRVRCSPSTLSSNFPTAAASSLAGAAATAPPMSASARADAPLPRQLMGSQPYEAPNWAQGLGPVPSTRLALGHLPTPIHRWNIPGLPKGTNLLIKRDDLSGMELSGNKVRKLEFLLAQAVAEGADCVVTIGGIQSNHCRATTVAARYLGLDTHLILRTAKTAVEADPGLVGNLLVERMAGAHIHLVSKEEYGQYGSMALGEKLVRQLEAEGRKPFLIPVGGSNVLGTWGYLEAIREIEAQLDSGLAAGASKVDHIVMACGSGGTTAGLALGSQLSSLKAKVHAYGVCDSPKYFYDFVQDLLEGLSASDLKAEDLVHVKDVKGQGYALSTEEELQLVKEVAEATGIVLDPVYSGKALKGMLEDMRASPGEWEDKTVLFIHTGGLLGMYEKLSQLQPLFGKWNRMAL